MTNVLVVTSSAQGSRSLSSDLAAHFVTQLQALDPGLVVTHRDVGADPLPHLVNDTVAGIRAEPTTAAEHQTRALSDALIAELQDADVVVIGSPMYNFGISSTLKTWFDHVLRARVTFRYTESGPVGLLAGRKAVVIETRAGVYSEGPSAVMDGQEPHLRAMLRFIGLDDARFVRVEGTAFGPEAAEAAMTKAKDELTRIAQQIVPAFA